MKRTPILAAPPSTYAFSPPSPPGRPFRRDHPRGRRSLPSGRAEFTVHGSLRAFSLSAIDGWRTAYEPEAREAVELGHRPEYDQIRVVLDLDAHRFAGQKSIKASSTTRWQPVSPRFCGAEPDVVPGCKASCRVIGVAEERPCRRPAPLTGLRTKALGRTVEIGSARRGQVDSAAPGERQALHIPKKWGRG